MLPVAGLVIGLGTGASGYASVEPFFGGIFSVVLTLFLLEMGVVAGRRLRDVRQAGLGLVAFGVLMPVRSGSVGVLTGEAVELSVGGAAVLGSGSSSGSSSRTTRWWPSCTPWRCCAGRSTTSEPDLRQRSGEVAVARAVTVVPSAEAVTTLTRGSSAGAASTTVTRVGSTDTSATRRPAMSAAGLRRR